MNEEYCFNDNVNDSWYHKIRVFNNHAYVDVVNTYDTYRFFEENKNE